MIKNNAADVNSAMIFENKIATKKELAEFLRFSESYINNLMNEGLPYYKVGRSVRFHLEKVMVWLNQRQMP